DAKSYHSRALPIPAPRRTDRALVFFMTGVSSAGSRVSMSIVSSQGNGKSKGSRISQKFLGTDNECRERDNLHHPIVSRNTWLSWSCVRSRCPLKRDAVPDFRVKKYR